MNTRYQVKLFNKSVNPNMQDPGDTLYHGHDHVEALRVYTFWTDKITEHRVAGHSSDTLLVRLETIFER